MFSVVEYYFNDVPIKYSCGYCKKQNAYKRHGMWAHTLTVQDYQNLVDRGWRRSGLYCYKPVNDQTCCAMYTIKCEALSFAITKSQKKIIKKLAKFLKDGKVSEEHGGKRARTKTYNDNPNQDIDICNIKNTHHLEKVSKLEPNFSESDDMVLGAECDNQISLTIDEEKSGEANSSIGNVNTQSQPAIINRLDSNDKNILPTTSNTSSSSDKQQSEMKISETDSSLPRKAKLLRIERARNRLLSKGKTIEEIDAYYKKKKKERNRSKSLDEYLSIVVDGVNKLELKLVRVSSEEFMATLDASVELFKKYQIAVHNDEPEECDQQSFLNFLGKSPLQHWKPSSGPPFGYGSFHQQYWLNGKLLAVGVIDILPSCVSSVYFFYDPTYSFLSLGTYSSLMEVTLTRELNKSAADLKYYYMGYYIHAIPKMRYKAKMRPSKLLCPETYKWFEIEKCLPKLTNSKYTRFNEDLDALDEDGIITNEDLLQVRVYYRGRRLYADARNIRRMFDDKKDDSNEVREYAELVGKKCAHKMYLVLS